MALVDLRGREAEPSVRSLVDAARGWIPIGWEADGELVAAVAVERDGDEIAIRSIAVRPERRGRRFGRALVDAVAGVATAERLVAAADEDCAGFFLRCGFSRETAGDGRVRWVRPISPRPAPAESTSALTLEELSAAIRAAWGRDTSDDPDEWSEDNPARGQCAVTALLVRELLGGEIVIANVVRDGRRVDRHAWNRLPGIELDLTRSQFRAGEEFEAPTVDVPVLTDRRKFRLFADRVRTRLGV